ncbi:adhesion G protein-coupled receptor L1-like isoform X2 [Varroa destructor]|uniref:Latrophilin Cirl n=1 Tax=Varroa destructor TaxID=109461 RepID=A0A7M7JDA1_VARDE|nr:adhesion G protein-coupled receptor L1-like isoform X2 [Varroa destructor]
MLFRTRQTESGPKGANAMLASVCRRTHRPVKTASAIIFAVFAAALISPVSSEGIKKRDKTTYLTTYACEGGVMNITCEDSHIIRLIRANYGRFSISLCNPQGSLDWSVNCMSRRSFRVVQMSCEKKKSCTLSAATEFFDDDPCPGTKKYLEAHYQCVPELSTTTTYKPPLIIFPPSITGGKPAHLPVFPSPPPPPTPSTTPPPIIRPSSLAPLTEVPSSEYDEKYDEPEPSPQTPQPPPIASREPPRIATFSPPLGGRSEIKVPNPLYEATSTTTTTTTQDPTTIDVFTREGAGVTPDAAETPVGRETHCPPRVVRDMAWNWTREGEMASHPCPMGSVGQASWQCGSNPPMWLSEFPDLSSCNSAWVRHIEVKIHDGSVSVVNLANELAEKSHLKPLFGGDLLHTTSLIQQLVARVEDRLTESTDSHQRQEVVQELMNAVIDFASNILDEQQAAAWNDLPSGEQRAAASTLLEALEKNAVLMLKNQYSPLNYSRVQNNIVAAVKVVAQHELEGDLRFPEPRDIASTEWIEAKDSLTLPQSTLLEHSRGGLVKVAFFLYKRINAILGTNFPPYTGLYGEYDPSNVSRVVNSRVLSATLDRPRLAGFAHPVRIVLQHEVAENTTEPQCIFWDFNKRDWSAEGCWIEDSNATHTICACNHLTNFALLMDVRPRPASYGGESALQVITYIGCCVSIVCLSLTLLALQLCRGLKGDRAAIHKNLCLCLLLAEIVFVLGIHWTSDRMTCGVIAGVLHYTFLAAFMWMFLEGFQLYVMLIEVFDLEKSRLYWYYPLAYGVPAVIVGVSVAVDPFSYGTSQHCWLRADNYFVLSFVGPVVAILFANLVFLGVAIFTMCRHASLANSVKTKETSKLSNLRIWIRGATVLVFLLGLTWAVGLVYVTSESVALAYVFTVLNSIQGLCIFVFHCFTNDKVQSEYRKCVVNCSWLPECLKGEKMGLHEHSADGARLPANLSGRGQLNGHPTLTALTTANHQTLLGQQQAATAATHTIPSQFWNLQKGQEICTTSGIYPRAATLDRRNVIPSQVILDSSRTTPRNNQLLHQQQQLQQHQQQIIAGSQMGLAQLNGISPHLTSAGPNTLGAIAVGRKKCNTLGGQLGKSRQAPPPPYGHLEGIDHIYESIDEDQDPNAMGRQQMLHAMHAAQAAQLHQQLNQHQLNLSQLQHDYNLQQQQQQQALHLRSPSEVSHHSDQRPLIQWGSPAGSFQQQHPSHSAQQNQQQGVYSNHSSQLSGDGSASNPLVMAVFDGQRVVCQMQQLQQSPTGQTSPPAPQPQTPPQGTPNHLSTDC